MLIALTKEFIIWPGDPWIGLQYFFHHINILKLLFISIFLVIMIVIRTCDYCQYGICVVCINVLPGFSILYDERVW